MTLLPIGRSEVLRHGSDVTLIGIGAMVYPALGAADLLMNNGIAATVVNGRFVKPLDTDLIRDLAETTGTIVTIEENVTLGGYGSAVTQYLANEDIPCRVLNLGLEDHFYDHASQGRLRDLAGLSPQAIADRVESLLTRTTPAAEMPAKQILHGVSD